MQPFNSVFVNRTLNMRQIQAIGFDMDHTLVQYNIPYFENTTHQILIQKLINEKKYPSVIAHFKFNMDKITRGLVIDTQKGNVLKVSRYRSIRTVYHGETQIEHKDLQRIYPTKYIHFGIDHPHFSFVESHYSLALTLLYMQIVELKKKHPSIPDYSQIFSDIYSVISDIHNHSLVKCKVMENPGKYLKINPSITRQLENLIQHGKRLFLLTNSSIDYCSFLMNHTISPFLKKHSSWQDIFEYVITSADKPHFFHKKKEFNQISTPNFKIIKKSFIPDKGVHQFGYAKGLTQALHLKDNEILYIGDQVYTDVVLLKQKCGWRTALVIEELAKEQQIRKTQQPLYEEINQLMKQKIPIETQINQLVSDQIENNHKKHEFKIINLLKKTEKLDRKLGNKITTINQSYNLFWGELLRTGMEESLFASQAERFSCIYMSRILDFLSLSPRTYYRSKKRLFPHEMQ